MTASGRDGAEQRSRHRGPSGFRAAGHCKSGIGLVPRRARAIRSGRFACRTQVFSFDTMAPPQPHPSHQSSKRKLSSKADLWRPWFATRQVQLLRQMPARSRFHAGLRRCTCARRPRTPTANSQRGAPRSRVWTPVWTVRAINKIIKLIQYFTIVVGGAGEWRPAAAARNRGLGRSGTPPDRIANPSLFGLLAMRPPTRTRRRQLVIWGKRSRLARRGA
jgi:hypothetical protein